MGTLYYIVNHTKKEYLNPICKIGEIYLNPYIMVGILETIREGWNNNKIAILSEYQMEKYWDLGYKELAINWDDYRDHVE